MDFEVILRESVDLLYNWVKQEEYYGWDPYDSLNSEIIQKLCMKNNYLETLIIQFNKFSPVNFRPLFKIDKGIDLKGLILFANSYTKMYNLTNDNKYKKDLQSCLGIIKSKSLRKLYNYDCWASHYFPYTSIDKNNLKNDAPDIIGTSQSIITLVEGYKILGDKELIKMASSACNFLLDCLLDNDGKNLFLRYTLTEKNRIVLNASAQGLEAMAYFLSIQENNEIRDVCEKLATFLIKNQRSDGSWFYSYYENGHNRNQLDFHQGYIIDALLAFTKLSGDNIDLMPCIEKASSFYINNLFQKDGRSVYRYPTRYPVDIHNQAQGIITFSKLEFIDENYLQFSKKIACWTILNMRDKKGYYYYQKWPHITNKVPYMRWGQAWMMLALSVLLTTVCQLKGD